MYAKDPYLDTAAPAHPSALSAATALLRTLSRALDTLAERLSPAQRRPRLADPVLEFYADAGAPEGALYIDGKLVGHVQGITRL